MRTTKNSEQGAKTPRFCAPVVSLLLGTLAIPLMAAIVPGLWEAKYMQRERIAASAPRQMGVVICF